MSKLWSKRVHELTPYVPGEQPRAANIVKLNTNENAYGPSPKAIAAIRDATTDSLKRYPDPDATELKATIADFNALSAEQVFVGNGSDEVLAHCYQGLLKHDSPILFPDITYSFYPVYCHLYDIEYRAIPLRDDFSIEVSDYGHKNSGIIFANPNAPTGRALPLVAIESLLQQNTESVVIVDEAYIAFGAETATSLIDDYANLLVVQTLSKSHSLAGLRVGFALGHADLIEGLERIKNSFNSYPLDRLALVGAAAAIKDRAYYESTRAKVIATRERLNDALLALEFEVVPSRANFLFVRHSSIAGGDIARKLRERSIIVRHFNAPRTSDYLRITVGTNREVDALLGALVEILS